MWARYEVDWPESVIAAARAWSAGGELVWLDDSSAAGAGGALRRTAASAACSAIFVRPLAVLSQAEGQAARLTVGGRELQSDASGWRLWRAVNGRLPRADPCGFALCPGWAGYVGFEAVRMLERLPASHTLAPQVPVLRMALFDRGVVLDHTRRQAWLVAMPQAREALGLAEDPIEAEIEAWGRACRAGVVGTGADSGQADRTVGKLWVRKSGFGGSGFGSIDWRTRDGPAERAQTPRVQDATASPSPPRVTFETPRREHEQRVARAIRYIAAGDIYQVNLAHRLRFEGLGDCWRLYERLRRRNPAPCGALLRWQDQAVLSVSPELLLRARGRDVLTCPIKGTRPRSTDPAADAELVRELLESPKERAELAMIVDLHRNDLGRVCEYGSVRVRSPRRLESHATVHHTVAEVVGRLAAGRDALDALAACFPAGSVSGVPKIRALEIIDELEAAARGVYCGAIGVLGLDGSMTFNVAIRTMHVCGASGTAWAGGGIVAESDPAAEYEETLAKAASVLAAFDAAGQPHAAAPV